MVWFISGLITVANSSQLTHTYISTYVWTLSAMTSKNKNDGDSWGTLYGRPMERLAFCYDRHEEIANYIWMWHIYYHPMVIRVFLTFKNFQLVLLFQMPSSKIEYFIWSLTNLLRLNFFCTKVPQLKPPFLVFDIIADKVHYYMWLGLQKSTMWVQKFTNFFHLCSIITYKLFVQTQ